MINLTKDALSEILEYHSDTGLFTRKKILNFKQKLGETVGSKDAKGYIIIRFNGKQYKAHRLAWLVTHGELPTGEIDHINRIKSDNRIVNLRDVDKSVNQQNRNNVKGYSKDGNRWKSQIRYRGKFKHLGCYATETDAYLAYVSAKSEYHMKAREL